MKNFAPELVKSKPQGKLGGIGGTSIADVEAEQPNPTAKQKKPYEKPAFRHEKVFVTTALSCGKMSGTRAISKVS